jgi:hypothetical protein
MARSSHSVWFNAPSSIFSKATTPARLKLTLLIQTHNRQAEFDLPLRRGLIEQLALDASVRGLTTAGLIRKIVTQVMEKNLAGEIIRHGRSGSIRRCLP